MNILLVKTSSMGDVLHNLPVVSDLCRHLGGIHVGWVVEEGFAALPILHPRVSKVIPVAVRRWRKSLWSSRGEVQAVCRELREGNYDMVLDTQGLLKSALITRCARTESYGYGWRSAREPMASLFYRHAFDVPKNLHAVERNRQLAGKALGYEPEGTPDYGIRIPDLQLDWLPQGEYAVFLHATSRDDKLWDERNWIALGNCYSRIGVRVVLPWGNESEYARGMRLGQAIPEAVVAPRLRLDEAAALLGRAQFVVGVDTGLSHLAAALGKPTVGIYTATDPGLTGLFAGLQAVNLGGASRPPSVGQVIETLGDMGFHG